MKEVLCSLSIFCFLIQVVDAQRGNGYRITGKIADLPEGTEFYLVRSLNGKPDTVARTKSTIHEFDFKGVLALEGEHYFIKMDTTEVKLRPGLKSYVTLFLDNSNVLLSGTLARWPDIDIKGSKPTEEYENFLKLDQQYNLTQQYLEDWRSKGSDTSILTSAQARYKRFLLEYSASHPDSYVSPYCIFNASAAMTVVDIINAHNHLSEKTKNSYYGLKLKDRITILKNKSALFIGGVIPDFLVETLDGRRVSIKEIAGRSTYTLIDFWAWWCVPCREEIPNLKRVYKDFNSEGFNILGVSTDPDLKKWKKAIKEDGAPWLHGMQVDDVSKLIFDIRSIPAYILIDQKGEMIAVDCGNCGFSNKYRGSDYITENPKDKGLRKNLHQVIDSLLSQSRQKLSSGSND